MHVCKNAEKGVSACVPVAVCQDECRRSTVMMLLAVMDPEGTRQRMMHRLQRRIW